MDNELIKLQEGLYLKIEQSIFRTLIAEQGFCFYKITENEPIYMIKAYLGINDNIELYKSIKITEELEIV